MRDGVERESETCACAVFVSVFRVPCSRAEKSALFV